MKTLKLDASAWTKPDDFYDALFPLLGAPNWHGRNLNALYDSIAGGGINQVEPPFTVLVEHTDQLTTGMAKLLQDVADLFADARHETGAQLWFSRG